MLKLDYSLETPEERNQLVMQIIAENPDLNDSYLDTLADYLILCMEKQEKKQRKILTENRLITVNKRETSFEGLVSQFENGEDGIYSLITEDKSIIFQPKISITKKDIEEIPALKQVRDAIELWETKLKTAQGRDAYIIRRTLIDLRKDQYVIKNAYRRPIVPTKLTRSKYLLKLEEKITVNPDGTITASGITLLNPQVCLFIQQNYSKLKEDSYSNFENDTWYLMQDFDVISAKALAAHPLYLRLLELKIDGVQNVEIQRLLQEEFGIKHSIEYISNLWCNKIPKLIAQEATDEYLNWYYLQEQPGTYKRCSCCGQIKLATNRYFSRNNTSKDGWYSICKQCRNARTLEKRLGKTC